MFKRVVLWLCFTVCTFIAMPSFAQSNGGTDAMGNPTGTSSSQSAPTDPGAIQAAKDNAKFWASIGQIPAYLQAKIGNVTGSLQGAGMGLADKSQVFALALGGGLALLYLLYQTFLLMAKRTNFVQMMFDIGVPCVIAGFLIQNYSSLFNNFVGPNMMGQVTSLGGNNPLSATFNMYGTVFSVCSNVMENEFGLLSAATGGPDSGFIGTMKALMSLTNWGEIGIILLEMLVVCIFVILCVLICLDGVAEVVGLVLLGPFLIGVACAFGKIFIVFLVTPWTRTWFGNWLAFLIGGGMITAVMNVIMNIAGTMFGALIPAQLATEQTQAASGPATMLEVVCILMAVNSLIKQTPQIASNLIGGFGGVGSADAVRKNAKIAAKGSAKGAAGAAKGVATVATKAWRMAKAA